MLENPRSPRVRAVAKLTKRSARTETGLFLLEGPQAVREALSYRPDAIVELFATPTGWERHPDIRAKAAEHDVEVEYVTEYVLNAMADTVTPQGLVAVWTSDTVSAVPPSDTISHWAPTVCIHVPTFETVWAIQRARKTGCRRGAQAFTRR